MKKTSLMIIVLTTIFTILFGFYHSQQAAEQPVELKPSKSAVKRGETFTVTLKTNNNPKRVGGIFGYEDDLGFKIKYDSNKVELTKGEAINTTDWNASTGKGTIALMMEPNSSEEVYKFTFKVKENAGYGTTRIETTDLNVMFEDDSELNNVKAGVDINIQEAQAQNEVSNQTQNEVTNEVQNQTGNQTTNETQNEIPQNNIVKPTNNEIPQNNIVKPTNNEVPATNNNMKNDTNTTNVVERDPTTAKEAIPYAGVTYTILIAAMVMAIVAGIIRIVIKYYDKQ